MLFTFSPYAIPLFFAALIMGGLAAYAWHRRHERNEATMLALLLVAVAGWTAAYGMEILGATAAVKGFWEVWSVAFSGWIAPAWLLFALRYTGRDSWLNRLTATLLAVPTMVTTLLAVTNPWHHWVWTGFEVDASGPFLAAVPHYGPWFWFHAIFSYGYILMGMLLYLLHFRRLPSLYRRQSILLLFVGALPLLGNLFYILNLVPIQGLDPGPFAFSISGGLLFVALFRYRLLDLTPVAQRTVLESMQDGVIVLNDEGRIVEVNPAAHRLLRLEGASLIGQLAAVVLQSLQLTPQQQAQETVRQEICLENSDRRWVEVTITPLSNARGALRGSLVVLRDITAQHQLAQMREDMVKMMESAYRDLAKQHAELNTILQNVADGLVVTNLQAEIVLLNPTFAAITGGHAATLVGRPLAEVLPDAALAAAVATAQAQAPLVATADVVWQGRTYRALACALGGGAYPVTGVVAVLRDMTQEVELAQMKDEFVSLVSHELRTPMTSVLGFSRLIQKQFVRNILPALPTDAVRAHQSAQRVMENLEVIVSEGERLTRLVNDMLDLARMEARRVVWEEVPLSLGEVIARSVNGVASLALERGLEISVQVVDELPLLSGDRDRLVQVVTNLLSNAIKFTDEGQILVQAWLLPAGSDLVPWGVRAPNLETGLPAAQACVVVSIQDTGIGIAEEDLGKLFEKFRRVGEHSGSAQRPGTGLGLPICRQIVEHHGGHIWVESRLGVGSRFLFTLPVGEV